MNDIDYEKRLELLKLPSLEFRRKRGDMIETYKILHGFYDVNTTNSLFTLTDTNTRGHPLKLAKISRNKNLYGNFFTNRVLNDWNSLPHDTVMAGSINMFKNALDAH